MQMRKIKEGVFWVGAVDWDRRLFDALVPLPDGTSYNAYLVTGSEKTVLIDSVDPAFSAHLLTKLQDVARVDYIVANHAEQDHSGTIPLVLEKYPLAKVVVTPKCKDMLIDHLHIAPERFMTVADGETLSIGDKTLKFVHTPWVHWPETMSTFLVEDKILFSCDFFGAHLATSDLYAVDEMRVYEAAKRYYAEIMMAFRSVIRKNIEKVELLQPALIAPSHGPVYQRPQFIIDAYKDWLSDKPKNEVVIPYISMHGSTAQLVERLVYRLAEKNLTVYQFNLADSDIGKLAMSLVDAATIVLGTPTVYTAPHPKVSYAAMLANALRPKARFVSVVGSYGWATKAVEQLAGAISGLKVEVIAPVICKGMPREADLVAIDTLAAAIIEKHKTL